MSLNTASEWTWTAITLAGCVYSWRYARRRLRQMRRARDEDDWGLLLSARIAWRNSGAWAVALTAFFLAGVASLIDRQPPCQPVTVFRLAVIAALILGVVQILIALRRSERDHRDLEREIEAAIARRISEGL